MPSIEIDWKLVQAALDGLGLVNVPVYRARQLKDGTVELTTRFGVQKWKPPAKKRARRKKVGPVTEVTKKKET